MDSLVNNFIFCEFAMNWDSMKNSFFLYKDIDGLAKIGPQWDFDWPGATEICIDKYMVSDVMAHHRKCLHR